MAKKDYDDELLNEEQKAGVQAAKTRYEKAKAAGDRAGMEQAHRDAEAYRAQANYSGGSDGAQYIQLWKDTATTRPTYQDKYAKQIEELQKSITQRKPFSYDPESDPTYQQYKTQYERSGEKAMSDTLAKVSQKTGGLASSFAGTAAQQTYDTYMDALADKVPELRQLAYDMYLNEGNEQRANLDTLLALQQGEYGRYQDALAQYNSDRAFDYGVSRDRLADAQWQQNFDRGVLESDRAFDYQTERDKKEDARYEDETAYSRDMDRYAQALQRWQLTGAVSGADADILGVPAGTQTSDYRFALAQLALDRQQEARLNAQAAKSGTSSGSKSADKETKDGETGKLGAAAERLRSSIQSPAIPDEKKVDAIQGALEYGTITEAEAEALLAYIGYGEDFFTGNGK